MANVYAVAGGDWDSDIWATGPAGPAVPGLRPGAGDVALANGQQVAIAADATVAAFRADAFAGAADGGQFGVRDGVTLTGDVIPGQHAAILTESIE